MSNTQNYKNSYLVKGDLTFDQIRDEIINTYTTLPKWAKKVLKEDRFKYANSITAQIMQSDEERFKPYTILKQIATTLSGRTPQALAIYSTLRNEAPSIYSRYNSYMYRQGLSASEYFYKNAEYEGRGSIVTVSVNLPENGKRVIYSTLEIVIDMSKSLIIDINMY